MSIRSQLRAMGWSDAAIDAARVNGRPLTEAEPPKARERMNKWERLYAAELAERKRRGNIKAWAFESVKLRLADRTWYTPDFLLVFDSYMAFVEIKGFRRDDALVKFKVAREMYPFYWWTMLTRTKGGWEEVKI